jgi:hypothetical protein
MLHSFPPDGSKEIIVLDLVSNGNSERMSNSASTGLEMLFYSTGS